MLSQPPDWAAAPLCSRFFHPPGPCVLPPLQIHSLILQGSLSPALPPPPLHLPTHVSHSLSFQCRGNNKKYHSTVLLYQCQKTPLPPCLPVTNYCVISRPSRFVNLLSAPGHSTTPAVSRTPPPTLLQVFSHTCLCVALRMNLNISPATYNLLFVPTLLVLQGCDPPQRDKIRLDFSVPNIKT